MFRAMEHGTADQRSPIEAHRCASTRAAGYSERLALRDLTQLMAELGCRDAVNLERGVSNILLWARPDGGYRILNDGADQETSPRIKLGNRGPFRAAANAAESTR